MHEPCRGAMLVLVVVTAAAAVPASRAACTASRPVLSFDLENGSASYVYSPACGENGCADNDGATVSADAVAFFWALGRGNPVVGAGVDSGALPSLGGILQTAPSYPAWIQSDWNAPGVDGCVDDGPEPSCTALVLADFDDACDANIESCVQVAVLAAAEAGPGQGFVFDPPGGRIELVPVPQALSFAPGDLDVDLGELEVVVPRPVLPDYVDDACPSPLAGYRVYIHEVQTADPLTDFATWRLPASGGTAPDGGPLPFEKPTNVVFGCDDTFGWTPFREGVWLGYTLVFEDGYELPWVEVFDDEGYEDPFDVSGVAHCCFDGDGDGACRFGLTFPEDCDDMDPAVSPGGEQICGDLKNNDCLHPSWPDLEGTNEVDNDQDGVSVCAGDCNDRDPSVFAPAVVRDACDGRDNDCDGRFDQVPAVWRTINGARETSHFGVSLAALPDGRLLAGARRQAAGDIPEAGAVQVITIAGGIASQVLTHPQPMEGDSFGIGVAGVADVNDDGVADIVVGANLDDVDGVEDAGSAFVFSGAASDGHALIHVLDNPDPDVGDELGYAVTGLDDVDDDGVADVAVGARHDDGAGSVVVYGGATGAPLRTLRDPAGANGDLFGYAVGSIADLDDDGVGEVLVGAYAADTSAAPDAGKVFVFSGADGGLVTTFHDPSGFAGQQLGRSVVAIADRDGDGLDDVFAGAPALGTGPGEALVFSSATGAVLARLTDPAGGPGDGFGYRVAALDDLDGDAVGELLVGAFTDDTGEGANAGSVRLFSGGTLDDLPLPTSLGFEGVGLGAGALFGAALTRLPDHDGDGVDDFAVGAWSADVTAGPVYPAAGRVVVFRGAAEVDLDADGFGDVCDPDDDGDGVPDVDDCAPRYDLVSELPPVVDSVRFEASDRYLTWDPLAGHAFRVYEAILGPGGETPVFVCAVQPGQSTSDGRFFDSTIPAPGTAIAYLVRGLNACGSGPLAPASDDTARVPAEEC